MPLTKAWSSFREPPYLAGRAARTKTVQGENRVQSNGQDEKKNNRQWTDENGNIKPIGKWKGVELTEQQKADYISGKTVRLENVPDQAGQPCDDIHQVQQGKRAPFPATTPTRTKGRQ